MATVAASQKIVPFLWFNGNVEEAMNFYVSVFKNGTITSMRRSGDGSVFTGTLELEGQPLYLLNGGPMYPLTPAFSLFVNCEDQAEVDELWARLLEGGGREDRCGWLQDQFGLSWQIIPKALGRLLGDADPARAQRAMQAMMGMKKIDVAELERAAAGE
ncbi:MAG: 3-demethylubiquinone-9 3-methyltransferase [Flaviaesturariibacter sp.]|nr:3-demethylubiquinone-9 3-methyltransferase [Flaviaesturariibacter sp.]